MSGVLAWFLALPGKVKEWAAIAGAVIVAVVFAFLKIKQMGVDEQKAKDAKADDSLDTKLDQIDANTLSVDDAVERLRNRSRPPKR